MSAPVPETDPRRSIAEAATTRDEFSMLLKVVRAAEMVDTLASPGPFTMFAPTDAAFAKLPAGEVDRLLQPENHVRLVSFVANHILAGQLTAADLRARMLAGEGALRLRTVDNATIDIEGDGDTLRVLDARGTAVVVTGADWLHANGVIHITDSVIAPPVC